MPVTVTRSPGFREVHKLVVAAQDDGMRGLPVGYSVGGLLQPDDLSIGELAAIVNEAHRAHCTTDIAGAAVRLGNAAAFNLDSVGVRALQAAGRKLFSCPG